MLSLWLVEHLLAIAERDLAQLLDSDFRVDLGRLGRAVSDEVTDRLPPEVGVHEPLHARVPQRV